MGQEISDSHFSQEDYDCFKQRLMLETQYLADLQTKGQLRSPVRHIGYELEGCLVDKACQPSPKNPEFIRSINDPLVVPELATFNIELNAPADHLRPGVFSQLHQQLATRWHACQNVAQNLDIQTTMIGVLPTVKESHLCLAHMSPLARYRALNERVLALRSGRPIELDIRGEDHLRLQHDDVMLEAAATSFQLHLQVDIKEAALAYNLSKIFSAALVGVSANSPFLFGQSLWQETRIPIFEQAVSVGGTDYSKRVTFGIRYAKNDIQECFDANCMRYPVLLPEIMDTPIEEMAHLRLHNGTIWRWNRPLVGFNDDGSVHIRIEQRVIPAGPTCIDSIANAAFYFGLMQYYLEHSASLVDEIPFELARENFYASAQYGLKAVQKWKNGQTMTLKELLQKELLPAARSGLVSAHIPLAEIDTYLGIVEARVESEKTGAAWQCSWIERHGRDFSAMLQRYIDLQKDDCPVHRWLP